MTEDEALVAECRELLAAYGKLTEGMDSAEVVELCDEIVEVDSGEDLGKRRINCLHWAAERGCLPLLSHVLAVGNNIEGVTEAAEGATPLHLALVHGHAECVKLLAENNSDVNAQYEKQPCLHLAVMLGRFPHKREDSFTMLEALLAQNAEANALDSEGCTAVHRAAAGGFPEAIKALKAAGASLTQQDYGMANPLHHAVMCCTPDGVLCVEMLLCNYEEEDASKRSACYGTALELAEAVGNMQAAKLILGKYPAFGPAPMKEGNWVGEKAVNMLLLYSSTCGLHAPKAEYGPECAERLDVLIAEGKGILRAPEFGSRRVAFEHVAKNACITDILRVHEYQYVRKLRVLCEELPEKGVLRLDQDTAITSESYSAALCAAQAVVRAVDAVIDGDSETAFCCTRPAGHHAGPSGPSTCFFEAGQKSDSHGFCLFSNAAIGAAHALSVRARDGIQRVAIVDIDVHHGNGTEECVRNLVPHQISRAFETPIGEATFKNWSYKPWRDESDEDNVLFCSVHAHGDVTEAEGAKYSNGNVYTGMFYPGTGPIEKGVRGKGGILNVPLGPRFGSMEFRRAVERDVLPRLADFKPDLIVISAGFDAHMQDAMNYGLVTLAEEDYYWVTDRLRSVAVASGKGRVVSVLEGGYRVHGGVSSALARSVAAHVRAMCKPAPRPYVKEGALEALELVMKEVILHKERLAAAAEGGGRRKRKRAAVDYAALDAEMKK